jgi:hypothetical protein
MLYAKAGRKRHFVRVTKTDRFPQRHRVDHGQPPGGLATAVPECALDPAFRRDTRQMTRNISSAACVEIERSDGLLATAASKPYPFEAGYNTDPYGNHLGTPTFNR